jgi:hypothetical protein
MLGMKLGAAQQATSFYNFRSHNILPKLPERISTTPRESIKPFEEPFYCSLIILLPQTPLLSMASSLYCI